MALHAELRERQIEEDGTSLLFRIFDDNPDVGDLGYVTVPDSVPADVRVALRNAAQRLQALPVGKIIDL